MVKVDFDEVVVMEPFQANLLVLIIWSMMFMIG